VSLFAGKYGIIARSQMQVAQYAIGYALWQYTSEYTPIHTVVGAEGWAHYAYAYAVGDGSWEIQSRSEHVI
jgi:hypothetical protein